ncbi:MAG: FAD-dependent oxidoreductase [Rhizobiaceae bacterium]
MARERLYDVMVLGAGIVGISTAIHLRKLGLDTVLVDRREPGRETSYGNAGIIQREGVHPYLFPRNPVKLLQYALNIRPEAHYQIASALKVAPFLLRYFLASNQRVARRTFEANLPLFERCLTTHEALSGEAGASALIARNGWLKVLRSSGGIAAAEHEMADLASLGIGATALGEAELREIEPHVDASRIAHAVHYRDPWTVSDPGALCSAYARLFTRIGGVIETGDANSLQRQGNAFVVGDTVRASQAVVSLGPGSQILLDRFGIWSPLGVKRGYHQHFRAKGNAFLNRPVLDDDKGYVLAPMAQGIRLTSGAEFAAIDAPFNPVQIERCLPLARELVNLGDAVEDRPWMGSRPVMPDMLPVIGRSSEMPGLWFNFGHAHHGLTLGPVSGLLLAQMIAGQDTFTDPAPYSLDRFRR